MQVQATWAVTVSFRGSWSTSPRHIYSQTPNIAEDNISRTGTLSTGLSGMGLHLKNKKVILHVDEISHVHILNKE